MSCAPLLTMVLLAGASSVPLAAGAPAQLQEALYVLEGQHHESIGPTDALLVFEDLPDCADTERHFRRLGYETCWSSYHYRPAMADWLAALPQSRTQIVVVAAMPDLTCPDFLDVLVVGAKGQRRYIFTPAPPGGLQFWQPPTFDDWGPLQTQSGFAAGIRKTTPSPTPACSGRPAGAAEAER